MRTTLIYFIFLDLFIFDYCQKHSLVFIFDTTGSMNDDLVDFKIGVKSILDSLDDSYYDSSIQNFVLVPFNDPEFGPVTVTEDMEFFRQVVSDVSVIGGGDCPEMSFSGLLSGMEVAMEGSIIYVMTDANEKDSHLFDDIVDLIRRKNFQVMFFVTNGCTKYYENYEKIAGSSFGQVLYLKKGGSNVLSMLEYVNNTINEDRIALDYIINEKGDNETTVIIEETYISITAVVSGGNPIIEILSTSEEDFYNYTVREIINLPSVKAIEITNLTAGELVIKFGSDEQHSIRITAISSFDLKFQYGFTTYEATNMVETTSQPLIGVSNRILVELENGRDEIDQLIGLEIVTFSGKVLFELEFQNDNFTSYENFSFYLTNEFEPPEDIFFYLKIVVIDFEGNLIRRSSSTANIAQKPQKPRIFLNENELLVNIYDEVTLYCKFESLIPATVSWIENFDDIQNETYFLQSGEINMTLIIEDETFEEIYTCRATNFIGSSEKYITLIITDNTTETTVTEKTTTEIFSTTETTSSEIVITTETSTTTDTNDQDHLSSHMCLIFFAVLWSLVNLFNICF